MDCRANLSLQDLADNRNERIAIMTVEGVPEEEAQQYCDTRPELYGIRAESHSKKEAGQ